MKKTLFIILLFAAFIWEPISAETVPAKVKGEGDSNLTDANFEVLDIKVDPIREGQNAVRIKVKNTSAQKQVLATYIQTRSSDGGWGTTFIDIIKPDQTRWTRHACKLRGSITKDTYIRLQLYNPVPAEGFDREKWFKGKPWDTWFKKVKYFADELERHTIDESKIKAASKSQTQEVIKTLAQIQGHIKNKEYKTAWELFTQDFRDAEFQIGFENFKKCMELPQRFYMSRYEILSLRPESVSRYNEIFTLRAAMKDNIWVLDFIQVGEKYKLDSIKGSISNDWEERLLPMLEKRTTKHFDIYYFNDSTAKKEIEQIAEEKDKGFEEVCNFLNTKSDLRIKMIFFEDGKSKQMATGHQGAGWAFGNTIVEIYNEQQKLDAYHETVHVLMRSYGNPPALFNEGFAVYMSERLGTHALKSLSGGESSIYERVRKLKRKKEWIPLEELITYTEIGSRKTRPPVSYAQAASFVKFLIDTYGEDKFLAVYKHLQNSGSKQVQEKNIEKLANIYGKSMNELKKQWHDTFMGSEN